MMDRRSALQAAGLGTAALLSAPVAYAAARPGDVSGMPLRSRVGGHGAHGGHGGASGAGHAYPTTRPADAGTRPALEKFTLALPILPTARPVRRNSQGDLYLSRIRQVGAAVFPGHTTTAYGYFGSWVPPVIRARQGRRTLVTHYNDTRVPISVHLHGGVNREEFDGEMARPVAPGRAMTYRYDNDQPAASLWMHDHTHHTDADNVYRGMASPYLISSEAEDALGLPSGAYDIPLMLRDGDFDARGQFVFTMDDPASRSTILVNGRPWPSLHVHGRKYRFRLINASNMRFFVLALSDGSAMTQIGGDGGLLGAPAPAPVVVVTPGERADVVIDFAAYPPGTHLHLVNYAGPGPMEDVGQVMRFVVGEPVEDTSVVPATLTTLAAPRAARVTRQFTLLSSEPGVTPMTGSINGRTLAMDRVDVTVPFGSTEEWVVTNANATIPHNFHTHLAHFRVISRSERPVGPEESGDKDTVAIFPGQSVRLRLTFDTHRGVYPYHCHMLDHGAMGMAGQLRVV